MQVTIRRADPDEANALTNLTMRSKQSNGYDDAFMAACRKELTVTAELISLHEYWVADAGQLCGYACLSEGNHKTGEIHAFFIDPEWKRRGVGKLLWQKLLERAKAKGLISLHLDADPAAVPFYEAQGFKTICEVPSGSIAGRSLPHMEIILTQ
jgi:ribosomal protein S18 acetylase RimI-like enzyme